MHVRFVVNILGTKNCTQSALKPHNKSPETRINAEFPSSIFLLKLANKISPLYFLVLVLWFYLVLYVFYRPKSIGCTEQCYQFVIMFLLSNFIYTLNKFCHLFIHHFATYYFSQIQIAFGISFITNHSFRYYPYKQQSIPNCDPIFCWIRSMVIDKYRTTT